MAAVELCSVRCEPLLTKIYGVLAQEWRNAEEEVEEYVNTPQEKEGEKKVIGNFYFNIRTEGHLGITDRGQTSGHSVRMC